MSDSSEKKASNTDHFPPNKENRGTLEACERLLAREPDNIDARILKGRCLAAMKRTSEAVDYLQQVSTDHPSHPGPRRELARIYHSSGHIPQAIEQYHAALARDPDWAEGWINLALALQNANRVPAALQAARQAAKLAPGDPVTHNNLGGVLQQAGKTREAEHAYRTAIDLNPRYTDALINLGRLCSLQRRLEESAELLQRALTIDPGRVETLTALGDVLERMGKASQAYNLLDPYRDQLERDANAVLAFAQICASAGHENRAIATLENLVKTGGLTEKQKARAHFALGKLFDRAGNYTQAFNHYRRGNELDTFEFDARAFRKQVRDILNLYSPDRMQNAPRSNNRSTRPVFIIAMPRSGTSLLEQVLSSHHNIYGAGETELITGISGPFSQQFSEGSLTRKRIDEYASAYLDALNAPREGAERVTDKTVNSFLQLGIIRMMFPDAHIIHCMRNPLDTCLSCYFSRLGQWHPYSRRLEDLALFYREYHRAMQHWKRIPGMNILEVHYEDLVQDLESSARRIIEHIGLPWDPACTRFHENRRQVKTISYDQVRQPLYTRSMNRWQNYRSEIGSLINELQELL